MTLLISLLLATLTVFVLDCFIVTLMTIQDVSGKDWFACRAYKTWVLNFKESFLLTPCVIGIIVISGIFCIGICDIHHKIKLTEAGCCTCECKMCKQNVYNAKKIDAVIQYLSLDEEDINDLCEQRQSKKD